MAPSYLRGKQGQGVEQCQRIMKGTFDKHFFYIVQSKYYFYYTIFLILKLKTSA